MLLLCYFFCSRCLVDTSPFFILITERNNLFRRCSNYKSNKTNIEGVRRIVCRFGGEEIDSRPSRGQSAGVKRLGIANPCVGEDLSYVINVSPPLKLLMAIQRYPKLQLLGWHAWTIAVTVDHIGIEVTCYSERVLVLRPDGHTVTAFADFNQKNNSLDANGRYEAESYVSRGQYHATRVTVLPGALASEKSQAFQLDLSCAITYSGCVYPCQVIPQAWLKSLRDRQSQGLNLPEGAGDPRCPPH